MPVECIREDSDNHTSSFNSIDSDNMASVMNRSIDNQGNLNISTSGSNYADSNMNSLSHDTSIISDSSDYVGSSMNSVSDDSINTSHPLSSSSNTSIETRLNEFGGIKCMYTNADSISNKWTELETLVYIHQPDVIGITEIFPKGKDFDISSYVLKGFQPILNKNFIDKNNRGCVLFVRDGLEVKSYEKLNDLSSKEAVWCEISVNKTDKLLIGLVYRSPNSTEDNNTKLNELISVLSEETQIYKVIMGDFNYREVDWNHWTSSMPETHSSHEFIEAVRDSFLYQHIDFNTRFRNNQRPSMLDLIFSNDEFLVEDIEQFSPVGVSDHVLITFSIKCQMETSNTCDSQSFLYNIGDYDSMRSELASISWEEVFESKDLNERWDFFKNKLHECMDSYIPKRHFYTKNKRSDKPLWMTRKALKAVRKKHRSWAKYMRSREHIHFQYFCRDRNTATKECRKARKEFEEKLANESNPKSFYKYANSRRKVNMGLANLKREDGSVIDKDSEKAEELNNYFHSVFVKENTNNLPSLDDRSDGINISDVDISEEIIMKLLENVNINKSCGPDLLHPRVLKELKQVILSPLTLIFQYSMDQSELVSDWKTANVKALFKKGDRCNPSNYRPVSLTSVPCKIFEKLIRDKLVSHMTEHNLFSNAQFGFRSLRSCALQLLDVMEKWTEWLDEGKSFDCIYYDFTKAFDTVPHARLMEKLKSYGVTGQLLAWIKAFLHGRKQRVVVNSDHSDWTNVTSGVPQGSVLGPILFLIYINDIEDSIQSTIRLFADDMKLFHTVCSEEDIQQIQSDTDKLSQWSDKWLLKFNTGKCCTLHYGHNNPNASYHLKNGSGRQDIKNCNREKDLGITFDTDLKFRQHISDSINKGNQITGLVRRSFLHIKPKSFCKLYKTLIRPHLEYGNIIWYPRYKKDIEAIERVQKRSTKLVYNIRDLSYTQRLKVLKLPSLSYRRFRGDMIEVYKLLNMKEDIDYGIFFMLSDQSTRSNGRKLKVKTCKKDIRKNFFSLRVISEWNQLPESVVTAPSINCFKNRLDTFMGDKKYTVYPDNGWVKNQEGVK